MLLLRVPRADKRPRHGFPPQTPACWAKRGSHSLAFPRSGKGSALGATRGPCAARGAPGSIPRCRCGCLSPGQHGPGPGLLRGRSRDGNEYLHPLEKRSRHRRGAGRRLEPKLVTLPECEWARPAALGSGVLSFCFIRLSIGLGKEIRSFPIARCHMENLRYFDYALCKQFNIGSLKSRDCPKGD